MQAINHLETDQDGLFLITDNGKVMATNDLANNWVLLVDMNDYIEQTNNVILTSIKYSKNLDAILVSNAGKEAAVWKIKKPWCYP